MKTNLTYLFAFALILAACSGNEPVDTKSNNSTNKKRTKLEEENKFTSDDWIVVSFGLGEMGYQTPDDEVMLKGEYTFCRAFNENHASVRMQGNKMGLIDEKGNAVIPFEYNYTSSLGSGLLAVRKGKDDKVGYINLDKKYVVEPKYDMGFAFKSGRARVAIGNYIDMWDLKYLEICKYGFIDEEGEEIIEPIYDWAGDFADGIAPVAKNGRYFFIDKNGNKVDDKTYAQLSGFRGDLCWVRKGSKAGFINRENEVVIPFEYTNYMFFFNKGSRFASMNNESELGETSFQTEEGFFFLEKGSDKWGIVDSNNNILTPFEYSSLNLPEAGYIQYEKRGKSGFGSYDNGKITEIIPAEFSYIYHYPGHDHVEVGKGDFSNRKMGIYSIDGKEWVPVKYDDVESCGNQFFGVKIGEKWAILKGKEQITEPIYDYVGDVTNGKVYATRGDATVYVDSKGKETKL